MVAAKGGSRMFKKTLEDHVVDILVYSFMFFFSIITILPFLNVIAISLNEAMDTFKGGITFFPRRLTIANYKVVFQNSNIINAYIISIFRTFFGTALSMIFNSTTAYVLSKKYIKVRRHIMVFLVTTILFNGGIVPYYILLRNLKLINNILVYIIPGIYNVFNILIFRTYFENIPVSLEESARIDGAVDLEIMIKIIFPLSFPVFAALALFSGVGLWNDWFTGEFYINSPRLWTAQNYLLKVLQENALKDNIDKYRAVSNSNEGLRVSPESVRMAVIVVVCLPIMCIYPFLQKYFVKGVLIGAVKE